MGVAQVLCYCHLEVRVRVGAAAIECEGVVRHRLVVSAGLLRYVSEVVQCGHPAGMVAVPVMQGEGCFGGCPRPVVVAEFGQLARHSIERMGFAGRVAAFAVQPQGLFRML
jgi:hypothetical protein